MRIANVLSREDKTSPRVLTILPESSPVTSVRSPVSSHAEMAKANKLCTWIEAASASHFRFLGSVCQHAAARLGSRGTLDSDPVEQRLH